MDRFARIILGYHGAKSGDAAEFARKLLLGDIGIEEWKPSENEYDWLGHGIYFWEHAPERARRWAGPDGIVVGAVLQLGRCLDLTDVQYTDLLTDSFKGLEKSWRENGRTLPQNVGSELKNRKLDCLVINNLVELFGGFSSVRGAFEEGVPAFPGAALKRESHIQVSVRDTQCILGIFRPTFASRVEDQ